MNRKFIRRTLTSLVLLVLFAITLCAVTAGRWWPIPVWPTAAEWQAVGALGTLMVAIVAASYAWKQVVEARELRREQAQPYVLATPIPELSEGRQACLVIKNYGPRPAHDIAVHFPGAAVVVPSKDSHSQGTWSGTRDLRMAVSTLAPGQEIYECISIMDETDDEGVRSADVIVSYTDSSNEKFENKYVISHGPLGLFGKSDPLTEIGDQINQIRKTLQAWSTPDGRSFNAETPKEYQTRMEDPLNKSGA